MWTMKEYTESGIGEREKDSVCRDRVCYMEKDGIQVIALAKAAEEDAHARIGAQCAVRVLAQLLLENYDKLYEMKESVIQFQVAVNVQTELHHLCDQYGTGIGKLRPTLLGIAVDHDQGTFLAVHLGEGRILIDRDGRQRTISFPERGRSGKKTSPTSIRGVGKHVRVIRGDIEDIQGFTLLSDTAAPVISLVLQ